MTKEEWDELQRRVDAWVKHTGKAGMEKIAKDAEAAAQRVMDDAKIDPEQLRKPTTI